MEHEALTCSQCGAPASVLPCNVGDIVWVLRNYHGTIRPMPGVVESIIFSKYCHPCIIVYRVGRGVWGEKVFATREDAERGLIARNGTKKERE